MGVRVGRYELSERLGSGGMGEVWRARDPELNRWVAVKLMRTPENPEEAARFNREAVIAARLQHPNIAAVYETGQTPEGPFIAMQLIEGASLAKASMPRVERVRMVRDAARAVQYAHEQGVIHRDLKPENLMVSGDRVFVMDFGLARAIEGPSSLSGSGAVLGTPSYMSPEQAAGGRVDARSDVYSLGATLYALVAGRPPFVGKSSLHICEMVLTKEPAPPRSVNPSAPADLEAVILRCLEKNPAMRYASAAELAEDLDRHLRGEPVQARMRSGAARLLSRHRWMAAMAGVLVLIGAGAAVFMAFRKAQTASAEQSVLQTLGETARTCLAAVLDQRRVGRLDGTQEPAQRLEEACRRVIEARPDLAEPHYLRGRLYRAQLRFEEAEREQSAALAKDPAHAEARLERGLLRVRRYEQAMQERRLVWRVRQLWGANERNRETPDPGESLETPELKALKAEAQADLGGLGSAAARGLLARLAGRRGEARECFVQSTRESAEFEEAWQALGRMANEDGDFEAGERWYAQALERDRGYAPFLEERAMWRSMECARRFGRGEDALDLVKKAIADLDDALRLMPSWTQLYLQRSRSRAAVGFVVAQTTGDPIPHFLEAIRDADLALAREPRHAEALIARAIARHELARHQGARGEDPEPAYEEAVRDCDRAIEAGMIDEEPYLRRGLSKASWGAWRQSRGHDPVPSYRAAFEDLSDALNRGPLRAETWKARGTLGVNWANWMDSRREDPREHLGGAAKDLEKALQLAPDADDSWMQRACLHDVIARYERRMGRDPLPSLRRGLADAEQAVKLNPRRSVLVISRGELRMRVAAQLADLGSGEAMREYEGAVRDFDEALRMDSGRALTWVARCESRSALAALRRDAGRDPSADFEAAAEDGERAGVIDPKLADAWFAAGSAWAELGAHRIKQRQDPTETMKRALDALTKGLDLRPDEPRGRFYRGTANYNLAAWKIAQGIPVGKECRAALADFEEAVRLEPSYRETVAGAMARCRKYLE